MLYELCYHYQFLWITAYNLIIGSLIINIRYGESGPLKSSKVTWLVRIYHSWNSVLLLYALLSILTVIQCLCVCVWECCQYSYFYFNKGLAYLPNELYDCGESLSTSLPVILLKKKKKERPHKMVSSGLPLFFTSQLTQNKCHIGVNRWGSPLPGVPGPGALLSQALYVHQKAEGATDPHTCNLLWFNNRTRHTEGNTAWKN